MLYSGKVIPTGTTASAGSLNVVTFLKSDTSGLLGERCLLPNRSRAVYATKETSTENIGSLAITPSDRLPHASHPSKRTQ